MPPTLRRPSSKPSCASTLAALARLFLGGAAAIPFASPADAQPLLPPGFEDRIVLEDIDNPTDIAFLPSGRALVALKSGRIHLVANREFVYPPVKTLPANGELDRGLQTILIDPEFPVHPYLYVLYTRGGALPANQISRFDLTDNPGVDGVTIGNEFVLIDGLDSSGRIHSGGGMVFGPDGFLYVATGDGGFGSELSQDTNRLEGKILRLTREGLAAPGNPFGGIPGYRPEIYCTGLRNPFRMAIRPGTSEIFVNDVGYTSFEEVNRVLPGANYGWPLEEGPATIFADPVYAYTHDLPSNAITGGVFYEGSEFPVDYQGDYFFADFGHSTITRLVLDPSTGEVTLAEEFANGYPSATALRVGPDDALYVVMVLQNEIHKIVYVGDRNRPPRATIAATPTSGIAPITVELLAADAFDPDGDEMRFTWRIDNGTPITRSSPSFFRHFTQQRVYRIDLTVDDGRGGARTMPPLFFDANNSPPVPAIASPLPESDYAAGDSIEIAGGATDAEDGPLPNSALAWTIVFHHLTHSHPFLGPISGVGSGTVTIPRIGEPSTETWYEIRLTARDAGGATATQSIAIRPRIVPVTLETDPPGLGMTVDGRPVTTPYSYDAIEGFEQELSAPSPQYSAGGVPTPLRFARIEGEARSGRVRVRYPASPATYRALFKPFYPY